MRPCLDPLEAVRRVGPDQPWCVTLPACYPTILPYTSDHADDPCIDARHSFVERLRGRVDRHQTPTSNDARQITHRLTRIVQQHVPEFIFHESASDDASRQIKQHRRMQPSRWIFSEGIDGHLTSESSSEHIELDPFRYRSRSIVNTVAATEQ